MKYFIVFLLVSIMIFASTFGVLAQGGSNYVLNSTLTNCTNWSFDVGFICGSGVITASGVGANAYPSLSPVLVAGNTYYYSFEIISRSSGSLVFLQGGTSITSRSSVGVFTGSFVYTSGAINFYSNAFVGSFDNFYIYNYTPTPTVTNTPVLSPTPTNTPVPATATNTPIPPTATNTPIPPTATSTPVGIDPNYTNTVIQSPYFYQLALAGLVCFGLFGAWRFYFIYLGIIFLTFNNSEYRTYGMIYLVVVMAFQYLIGWIDIGRNASPMKDIT